MKILTIVGARPQFIKAAVVSRAISRIAGSHEVIVHTGQHYDRNMSEVFFHELAIPEPQYNLGINAMSNTVMTAKMIEGIQGVIEVEQPELVLVYGDTNSTLAGAIAARQNHIMLAHVEAGLRSYNMLMPEEMNRILTDRISNYLFCPTDTAINNLHEEGFANFKCRILLSGDVMYDASLFYAEMAEKKSTILKQLGIEKDYLLVTFHRSENVDDPENLSEIVSALNEISRRIKIVLPIHPRTKKRLAEQNLRLDFPVTDPVGYLDMIQLLRHSKLVMTDSGGLQKEAFFFKKYAVTLRNETEWTELVENGFNILSGTKKNDILESFDKTLKKESDFNVHLYGTGKAGEFIAHTLLNN